MDRYSRFGRALVVGQFSTMPPVGDQPPTGPAPRDVAVLAGDGNGDDAIFVIAGIHGYPGYPLQTGQAAEISFAKRGLPFLGPARDQLAAGDINGDGVDDLAIAAGSSTPGYGTGNYPGSIIVIPSRPTGLDVKHPRVITKDTTGVPGTTRSSEGIGINAALGDLNGDGHADLTLGIPNDRSIKDSAGSVLVMFGSSSGLTT